MRNIIENNTENQCIPHVSKLHYESDQSDITWH